MKVESIAECFKVLQNASKGKHSAILSTFIKLRLTLRLFLSCRFRQVLLYFGCEKTVQDETRNYQSTMARLSWQIYFLAEIHYWIHGKLTIWYLISFYVKRVGFLWRQIFRWTCGLHLSPKFIGQFYGNVDSFQTLWFVVFNYLKVCI